MTRAVRAALDRDWVQKNAWANHNTKNSPVAEHYNGYTYLTYSRMVLEDGLGLMVQRYDHSAGKWESLQEVERAYGRADNHFTPAISIADDGRIWLFAGFRNQSGRVWRSDTSEDITSFTEVTSVPVSTDTNYVQALTFGGTTYLISRDGGTNSGNLRFWWSTDDGSSWSVRDLVTSSGGDIPLAFEHDGSEFHILTDPYATTHGPLFHLRYDFGNDTLKESDGSALSRPTDETALTGTSSEISNNGNDIGCGFGIDGNGTYHVAYGTGADENDDQDFTVAYFDGSAWQSTTLATGYNTSKFLNAYLPENTQLLIRSNDDIEAYHMMGMLDGSETSIAKYVSTDGGQTWSSRQTLRSFSSADGARWFDVVKNRNGIAWVHTKSSGLDSSNYPDPAQIQPIYAMDVDGNYIGRQEQRAIHRLNVDESGTLQPINLRDSNANLITVSSEEIASFSGGNYREWAAQASNIGKDETVLPHSAGESFRDEFALVSGSDGTQIYGIGSTSGLPNYPDVGDTHLFEVVMRNSPSNGAWRVRFGNDQLGPNNGYLVKLEVGSGFYIGRYDTGSENTVASDTSTSVPVDSIIRCKVLHESDGTFTATFYDSSWTQITQVSGSDSNYITSGSYDATNVGIDTFRDTRDRFGSWRILERDPL